RSRAHAQLSTVAEPRERRGHIVREVDARRVDERDGSWEDRSPRFRVYLFVRGGGGDYSGTDTWDLSGVDVLDAIRWAQDQAGDEGLYALALVRDEPESDPSRGLVWLVGMDWFDSVDGDPERQRIKDRMIARRGRKVVSDEPL
ncbi:MAG TPA: hypothetical protein VIR58_02010, partial [Acidimicrobiales bacterium]